MKFTTVFKAVVAVVVVIAVTAVAILYSIDFSAYKGEVTKLVRDATGRDLVISGELELKIGLTPAIAVDGVRFSNAAWGSRKDMARIKQFRAEVELIPILFGDIRIKQIVLSGANILLESQKDGTGNWQMESPSKKDASLGSDKSDDAITIPTVDKVLIEQSVLVWRDGKTGAKSTIKIDRLQAVAETLDSPLNLNFKGSYDGAQVTLDGRLGALKKVASGGSLSVDLALSVGGANIGVKGTVNQPLNAKGINLALSAKGDDLAPLGELAGASVPSIGPYSVTALVADTGRRWQVKGLDLRIGKSNLTGDIWIDPGAKPTNVNAELTSSFIRLDDFRDRGKDTRKASAQNSATGKIDASKSDNGRVFSADPIPLDALKAVNAKLSLKAGHIEDSNLVIKDASINISLRDGNLVARPVKAVFADGTLAFDVTVNSGRGTPNLTLDFDMTKLDLANVLKVAGHPGLMTGRMNAKSKLTGSGKSVRAIMASLNGSVQATMNQGRLDDKLLNFLSADVLKAVSPWSSGEEGIRINCLIGRYDIRKGILTSKATVFDTTRLLVQGDGTINLGTEKIDFGVSPTAKETSIINFLVPLKIGGSLAAPSVYPDPGGVAKGALGIAAGIATGGISTVVGAVLSKVADSAAENPCIAALSSKKDGKKPVPSNTPAKSEPASPIKGVEKAIQGIGKGLKGLFGR